MQTFYIFIGRDSLYLYEEDDTGYNRQYIAGNPEFHYQTSRVKADVEKLLDALVEEYNLENRSELTFFLIGNEDSAVTEAVCKTLDGYISERYDFNLFIPGIIQKIEAEEMPLTKEFGINFDGKNYRLIDGKLNKYDYSLLGYNLNMDKIMEYIG